WPESSIALAMGSGKSDVNINLIIILHIWLIVKQINILSCFLFQQNYNYINHFNLSIYNHLE
ncbi:hypothetical protein, partial [Proteus mirabilis]|uniref:hypothetical protein n=1 Tax=Proteus mirabilis TaxID=584 RepID=UPI00195493F0